jgi:hypothetical protein
LRNGARYGASAGMSGSFHSGQHGITHPGARERNP